MQVSQKLVIDGASYGLTIHSGYLEAKKENPSYLGFASGMLTSFFFEKETLKFASTATRKYLVVGSSSVLSGGVGALVSIAIDPSTAHAPAPTPEDYANGPNPAPSQSQFENFLISDLYKITKTFNAQDTIDTFESTILEYKLETPEQRKEILRQVASDLLKEEDVDPSKVLLNMDQGVVYNPSYSPFFEEIAKASQLESMDEYFQMMSPNEAERAEVIDRVFSRLYEKIDQENAENPDYQRMHALFDKIYEEYGDGVLWDEKGKPELMLEYELRGAFCFPSGTPIHLSDNSSKPIEEIALGDEILSFDPRDNKGQGDRAPKRVIQTHRTEAQELIDFHGLQVTPGHAFLCGDGAFKPLIEILESDGSVVLADGREVRARTGLDVGSKDDQEIPVGYRDEVDQSVKTVTMRAGTPYGIQDGKVYSIGGMMHKQGYHLRPDGFFVNAEGDVRTAFWDWGKPDAKLRANHQASFADLLESSRVS